MRFANDASTSHYVPPVWPAGYAWTRMTTAYYSVTHDVLAVGRSSCWRAAPCIVML